MSYGVDEGCSNTHKLYSLSRFWLVLVGLFNTTCWFDSKKKKKTPRACLDNKKSSLNFRHSISITHHSSLITHYSSLITHHSFFHTHLATSLLFSSLNFFTLFMGPTPVSRYSVFFFFFFKYPTHEANII